MKEKNSQSLILAQSLPWTNNPNPIWLVSTISLSRNIEKFKFPGKLDTERRKQIISLVTKELLSSEVLEKPFLTRAEEMSPLEKEFLVEHFLATQSYHQAHVGEAFFLDKTGTFLAALNIADHIYLELIDCEGELEHAWGRLVKIETLLGKKIHFSFSPKFGFLTSDPNRCGTALRVAVFLQTPALIHSNSIDEFLEKNADDTLSISGIQGNPTDIIGDVFVVENNYTLGITEENCVSSLRSFTTKLLVAENAKRTKIKQEENAEFKDKISRAFAILVHSYQIEAVEALNAISLVKLGCDLGWVTGTSVLELNNLFFNCRRAHLMRQMSEKIGQEELLHKRAEFIHKSLKKMALTI